jgi:aspartate aminotransferase-like enzyme
VQADTEKKIKAVAVVHNETATGAKPQMLHASSIMV